MGGAKAYDWIAPPPFLDALRQRLDLSSSKMGCDHARRSAYGPSRRAKGA
jgi:aerobic-type carbon monoxide dehydrogenase small subunit (CoxS/CutS family)